MGLNPRRDRRCLGWRAGHQTPRQPARHSGCRHHRWLDRLPRLAPLRQSVQRSRVGRIVVLRVLADGINLAYPALPWLRSVRVNRSSDGCRPGRLPRTSPSSTGFRSARSSSPGLEGPVSHAPGHLMTPPFRRWYEHRGDNGHVGIAERQIRDRAEDSLAEMPSLDVRPVFSGFGFYLDGILVAAAWEGAFRLRYREDGRWIYRPVEPATLDNPMALVALVRERAHHLAREPSAGQRRRPGPARPGPGATASQRSRRTGRSA